MSCRIRGATSVARTNSGRRRMARHYLIREPRQDPIRASLFGVGADA
jgi:hypothetical protein